METTTPPTISDAVLTFCGEITSAAMPEYIQVEPDHTGIHGECFSNVRDRVKSEGGSIVYGWTIWEWPGVLLEAEFHSIWEDRDGARIDVTPKPDGERQILFLPDRSQEFDFETRQRRDNIRKALSQEPDVLEFIELGRRRKQILLTNAVSPGISDVDATEWLHLEQRIKELAFSLRSRKSAPLKRGKVGRNQSCPCGSKRKFKRCCGARG